MNSKLFIGTIRHRRFIVKPNDFKYQIFMLYLDLDELDHLFDDYWFWSNKGFNIASFKRKKYLGDPRKPLIQSVKEKIFESTGSKPDKVFLLTNLAYYGYCFNPISLYFCYTHNKISHVITEVTNTPWKEQHVYVLEPKLLKNNIYSASFQKEMHVSPFLKMNYEYRLRFKNQKDTMSVHIENWQDEICHFDATLAMRAKPINHKNLAGVLLKFPFMSAKVSGLIHWQALKLWLKKVPFIPHPKKD